MSDTLRHRRHRTTRRSVLAAERASRTIITVGGIGTIFAVTLILAFLVWVVVPLFSGAELERAGGRAGGRAVAISGSAAARLVPDEYGLLAAVVGTDGLVRVSRLDDGSLVEELDLFAGLRPTAFSLNGSAACFALAGGRVLIGELRIDARFLPEDALPDDVAALQPGEALQVGRTVVSRTPEGRHREHVFSATWREPLETRANGEIVLVDQVDVGSRTIVCALTDAGELSLIKVTSRPDMLTGETTYKVTRHPLPTDDLEARPAHLRLGGIGDDLYAIWDDGRLARMDVRDVEAARVVQKLDLVPEEGHGVTELTFLPGRSTLIVGDTLGRARAWFVTKPEDAGTLDGAVLSLGHDLAPGPGAVTALATSQRSRTLLVGHAGGAIRVFNVTSEKLLGSVTCDDGAAPVLLSFLPKEDGLLALSGSYLAEWTLDLSHPEADLAALFRPVWYEGYPGPEHVWQSSGGSDEFEPKLGLMPLVFGTVKATFYSMLFGVPIALLAAIYTSEFLDRRLRAPTKSVIEMMASLPSVVLGFLAALVIAPFVQAALAETLAVFLTLPVTVLTGAYAWQLLPRTLALRLRGVPRLLCMFLTLPIAVLLAWPVGPWLERLLFAGDIPRWLDGQVGGALGGWLFLVLPVCAFAVLLGMGRLVGPWLRSRSATWTHGQCARADFLRFLAGGLAAVALALAVSAGLDGLGLDPRGFFLGTYVQRNAMVVGFVMGFAIVPIIYTLAEDALSSVPDHLRLASLGAGATPWQTAVRVVVPTAMSGLFSAVMIGLGRAVGETMIVLMATGNTPVTDWNVFNGFRTLSANIAVELPEAVRNSTHYRTLFLAALVLFAVTFVLNTIAEAVRQRFRKRAYQV